MTQVIRENISTAAEIIKNGGLVAVPTETVYGLAGNGLDEKTVQEIYEVKGRPAIKPLSLMVPDASCMEKYCDDVPENAKYLAAKFWPGPLTIVLKAKSIVPEIVRAGGETVGLRCPDHPMTLEALRLAELPFAAPSANPSGEPSPKNAEKVMEYFDGKIAAVIDGGECGIGLESTLISMAQTPYKILRRGALDYETIADALVSKMCVIGITGGTGCGKTTALNTLKEYGALIIDCDAVYHELLSGSHALINELGEAFPGAVIEGKLDRKALGAIVFKNESKLNVLNSITHRYIIEETVRRLREYAMNGGSIAAIDAIELISSGVSRLCCATVGVIADEDVRVERIMARDGISREYAKMRVKAQKSNTYFITNCDHTLVNNSTPEAFAEECRKIYEEIFRKWKT